MKLKSFGGGQASRAEVYGLFIAAFVLLGGGIGGAYAITSTINQNDVQGISEAQSQSPTPSQSEAENDPAADENSPEGSNSNGPPSANGNSQTNPEPDSSAQQPAPVAPPAPPAAPVDTRIQTPYIGPANTFSYLSRNHICGWDTEALGGFGWGYDPAEPCNDEFVAYIGQHCTAGDGVVFAQRCDEYFAGTLPVAY
jgi:hypothetical protein